MIVMYYDYTMYIKNNAPRNNGNVRKFGTLQAEVEWRTQRPRKQKNSRLRAGFPRTDPLEAKDIMCKCSPNKKSSRKILATNFPWNSGVLRKKKGLHKLSSRALACSPNTKEKNCHVLVPFSANQKPVLSSTEDSAFSRTCWLRG